jgi:hypothetical protein
MHFILLLSERRISYNLIADATKALSLSVGCVLTAGNERRSSLLDLRLKLELRFIKTRCLAMRYICFESSYDYFNIGSKHYSQPVNQYRTGYSIAKNTGHEQAHGQQYA